MRKYEFTKQEKEAVKAAVEALEKESCGEVVPLFTRQSDDYTEISWYISALFGISALGVIALLSYLWMLPEISYIEAFIGILLFMISGFAIPLIFPTVKRVLVSKERAIEMVSLRAQEAFLNEKVYNTEEHVGILIYVSRLEHLVLVLGDEGINQKVKSEDWTNVVSAITDGLKKGEIGNGFVAGINNCKELLLQHGFKRKATDTNELSNELRIK